MVSKTKLDFIDAVTVKIRYYDDGPTGKYRSWEIPLREAKDITRWWAECELQVDSRREATREQRFGSVLVSVISAAQIFVRGCDSRGRGATTGYQLPPDAVTDLCTWIAEHDTPSASMSDVTAIPR
jgi:hypothetical protein